MTKRKGQVAITTIVALLATAGIAIGGTFFTSELISLLSLITNNIFYAGILVVAIIIAFTFNSYIKANTDISPAIAASGAILVMALAIGAPFLTGKIAQMQSTYTATFTAQATGGVFGGVNYEGIELKNLEQGGPKFFSVVSEQSAALFSTDYDVEVTVSCDGENIGTTTLSADAPNNAEGQISSIPPQSDCIAEGVMTKPADHSGQIGDQVEFNTP